MWKLIAINAIIPMCSLFFILLENITKNGERVLSVKYRLWMFDYGFILVVLQLIILIVTLFFGRKGNID